MGLWCLGLRVNQAACPAMAPGALGFPKPWGYDLAVAPQFGKPPNDWRWAAAISSGNGGCLYEQTFLSYSAAPALQTYAILQSGFFRLNVEGWLHWCFLDASFPDGTTYFWNPYTWGRKNHGVQMFPDIPIHPKHKDGKIDLPGKCFGLDLGFPKTVSIRRHQMWLENPKLV